MLQCFYGPGLPTNDRVTYTLAHFNALEDILRDPKFVGLHALPVKTFVSMQFKVRTDDCNREFQLRFNGWKSELVHAVARIVDAFRVAGVGQPLRLAPLSTAIPVFWLAFRRDDGERGWIQVAGDFEYAAFRSLSSLDGAPADKVRTMLAAGLRAEPWESSIALAAGFIHHGHLDLAVVQICVACESVLAKAYREYMKEHGVSKQKLEESEPDITFSELLNLHLFSMRDISLLQGHTQILGAVNWARKRRNEVVHKGEFAVNVTPNEVTNALEAARNLIAFVQGGVTLVQGDGNTWTTWS